MGLKQNLTTIQGVHLPEGYIRINDQRGRTETIIIEVGIYTDKQKCIDGCPPVEVRNLSFTLSVEEGAPNNIKQGYEWMKTLEEYEDAIDY